MNALFNALYFRNERAEQLCIELQTVPFITILGLGLYTCTVSKTQ